MTRKCRWPGRAACLGLALLFAATGAEGQNLLGVKGDAKPLEINADNGIEWRRDQKVYVASGNARAARGDIDLLVPPPFDPVVGVDLERLCAPVDAEQVLRIRACGGK